MISIRVLFFGFAALIFAGCAVRKQPDVRARSGPLDQSVYLVNNDWHTGLAVRKDAVQSVWPVKDFPSADFLEVGWGNNRFYRAQKTNVLLAAQAAFPSESAMQVVGVKGSVASFFRGDEVLQVRISAEEVRRLCAFIGGYFQRDAHGQPVYLGPGVCGPTSRFYGSVGRYSIGTTCNVWTAQALQAAGLPVRPAMTAEGLASQVRRFAVPASAPPLPAGH